MSESWGRITEKMAPYSLAQAVNLGEVCENAHGFNCKLMRGKFTDWRCRNDLGTRWMFPIIALVGGPGGKWLSRRPSFHNLNQYPRRVRDTKQRMVYVMRAIKWNTDWILPHFYKWFNLSRQPSSEYRERNADPHGGSIIFHTDQDADRWT